MSKIFILLKTTQYESIDMNPTYNDYSHVEMHDNLSRILNNETDDMFMKEDEDIEYKPFSIDEL
jgi:hypothetical protein